MNASTHILVVEDDQVFARILSEAIRIKLSCKVSVLFRGDQAVAYILQHPPDLLVLDVGLPGLDGFEVCRRVRDQYRGPILFLTAESADAEQLTGLDLGADDYVCKPVSLPVILARIQVLLRRFQIQVQVLSEDRTLELGDLCLEPALRRARRAGRDLELTEQEFYLLWALSRRAGKACSRDDLHLELFGLAWDGRCRQLDNLVRRLRVKISDESGEESWIKTLRNVGYMLMRPRSS